jgi:hypothetical protein
MNLILKQFLIIGATFLIILWFQYQDDKKHKRVRKTFYEQYKFPILVSSIIGLVLNLPTLFNIGDKSIETLTELTIITPIEKCLEQKTMAKAFIHNNNFGSHGKNQMSWFDNKPASDQQIFTDLPDF